MMATYGHQGGYAFNEDQRAAMRDDAEKAIETERKQKACKHEGFACNCEVSRLEDIGRFTVAITIKCDQCGLPFRFIGLPAGVDLNGAAVSIDGCEARLAIAPKGE